LAVATEVKQRNNRVLVLVGAVLALGAFGAVLYLSRSNTTDSGSAAQTTPVVVAKVDLTRSTQLSDLPNQLQIIQLPSDRAPVGAYQDFTGLTGKYLAISVGRNTPIVPESLVNDVNAVKTATLATQPLDITLGMVAVAIPAGTDLNQVGCNIHPEDHIDFLIDPGNGSVRFGFQDVRVLTVGDYGGTATGCAPVFVVELPRAQAEQVVFLTAGKGPQNVVRFVLRPHAEYGKIGGTPAYPNYEGIDTKYGPKSELAGSPSVPAPPDQAVSAQTFNQLFPPR
jgi:Flp pilus assembly protein CpaB